MVTKQYTLLCIISESRNVMMKSFLELGALKQYAKVVYHIKDLAKLKKVDDDGYIWFVDGRSENNK